MFKNKREKKYYFFGIIVGAEFLELLTILLFDCFVIVIFIKTFHFEFGHLLITSIRTFLDY